MMIMGLSQGFIQSITIWLTLLTSFSTTLHSQKIVSAKDIWWSMNLVILFNRMIVDSNKITFLVYLFWTKLYLLLWCLLQSMVHQPASDIEPEFSLNTWCLAVDTEGSFVSFSHQPLFLLSPHQVQECTPVYIEGRYQEPVTSGPWNYL